MTKDLVSAAPGKFMRLEQALSAKMHEFSQAGGKMRPLLRLEAILLK